MIRDDLKEIANYSGFREYRGLRGEPLSLEACAALLPNDAEPLRTIWKRSEAPASIPTQLCREAFVGEAGYRSLVG
jgi:hypothetical protein